MNLGSGIQATNARGEKSGHMSDVWGHQKTREYLAEMSHPNVRMSVSRLDPNPGRTTTRLSPRSDQNSYNPPLVPPTGLTMGLQELDTSIETPGREEIGEEKGF